MVDILLHDETQLIDWGESRAGGPWIKLRLNDPAQLEVFRGMDTATMKKSGHILNVTITQGDILAEETKPPPESESGKYGEYAKQLKLTGFFLNPKIVLKVGSDAEFRAWINKQKSCVSNRADWCEEIGEFRCEAAHVRRSSNSGTAFKPAYCCVPLTREEHALQHSAGESALKPELDRQAVDEWFQNQASKYMEQWAWEKLKSALGYESWADVPPEVLVEWASEKDVYSALPKIYREHIESGKGGVISDR